MDDFTRLTKLEVTDTLKVKEIRLAGVTGIAAISSADATASGADGPTQADFKKTVDLCNELKTQMNKIIGALT